MVCDSVNLFRIIDFLIESKWNFDKHLKSTKLVFKILKTVLKRLNVFCQTGKKTI